MKFEMDMFLMTSTNSGKSVNVLHHGSSHLPLEQGQPDVIHLHVDPLDRRLRRVVPAPLIDHLHAEHGEPAGGHAGLGQDVGAGGHEAEERPVEGAALWVGVDGTGPSSRDPLSGALAGPTACLTPCRRRRHRW